MLRRISETDRIACGHLVQVLREVAEEIRTHTTKIGEAGSALRLRKDAVQREAGDALQNQFALLRTLGFELGNPFCANPQSELWREELHDHFVHSIATLTMAIDRITESMPAVRPLKDAAKTLQDVISPLRTCIATLQREMEADRGKRGEP